jgi:hypothetical protein
MIVILSALTIFHVLISLVAIGAGLPIVYGLLASKRLEGWTSLFLTTTVATSVTGFFFPYHGFTPGHAVGILSLILLTFSILARYRFALAGGWRRTYAVTAVTALYLNVFVLIVQLFEKVPGLKALAPTQSEPPFQVTQLIVLVLFAALAILAAIKFHAEPRPPNPWMAHPASNR